MLRAAVATPAMHTAVAPHNTAPKSKRAVGYHVGDESAPLQNCSRDWPRPRRAFLRAAPGGGANGGRGPCSAIRFFGMPTMEVLHIAPY